MSALHMKTHVVSILRSATVHSTSLNKYVPKHRSSHPHTEKHIPVPLRYKTQNQDIIKHTVGIKTRFSQSLTLLRAYQLRLKVATASIFLSIHA